MSNKQLNNIKKILLFNIKTENQKLVNVIEIMLEKKNSLSENNEIPLSENNQVINQSSISEEELIKLLNSNEKLSVSLGQIMLLLSQIQELSYESISLLKKYIK